MTLRSTQIIGPGSTPGHSRAPILARSSLPPELLRSAHRRVFSLTLFILVMSSLSVPFFATDIGAPYIEQMFFHPLWALGPLLGITVVLFLLSRVKRFDAQRLLDLALIFEVLWALGTGLGRHALPWPEAHTRDWSEVGVWIVVFSVIIPNAPWKTALAAVLSGLMDPLGLAVGVAAGLPMPTPELLAPMFGPTALAVVLSIFLSRFIFRMGRDIQRAREMGSYKLVERLGRGGMGEVWRAEHRMLARPAAIKLIPEDQLAQGSAAEVHTALRRFEREAQATAQLQSEHTIHLYDYGTTGDGTCYYVMEFLDGLDVEELVETHGALPPERVVHLLLQVCESLQEAHGVGLIHRDIKPANIYVCRKGPRKDVVKVLDFGLVRRAAADRTDESRLTMEGRITGTPAFIAPEAALGEGDVDGRADLYALGCVAWWMLTGTLLFPEETPMKHLLAHINEPPPSLQSRCELPLPDGLEACIQDCLAKRPEERPQTAQELATRLRAISLATPWTPERIDRWWETHAVGSA